MLHHKYSRSHPAMELLEPRESLHASGMDLQLAVPIQTHSAQILAKAQKPAIDFLTIAGFNAANSTWNYNITARSGGHSASGTADTSVDQDTPTSWDWDADINATNAEDIDEDFTWQQTPDGVNLNDISETANGGYVNESINFDNLQVAGPTLAKKFTSSSPIEIDATGSPELDGTAKVTTKVLGTKSVTVPAGKFSATEVSLVISYSAQGSTADDGDDETEGGNINVSAHGTDTETFYVVNGVGIVNVISKAAESEKATRQRTVNVNDTITSVLTDYDYEAPNQELLGESVKGSV